MSAWKRFPQRQWPLLSASERPTAQPCGVVKIYKVDHDRGLLSITTTNPQTTITTMGLFDMFEAFGHEEASQQYEQVYVQPHHQASKAHEGK